MRNQRSAMLLCGVSAVLLGTSSVTQSHEVPDPIKRTPVANTVADGTATTVTQAQPTTPDPAMENDQSSSNPMGATSSSGSSMERDQASSNRSGAGGDTAWILIPVAMQAQSDQMTQGCWVRLYSGDNFEGRQLTIAGPANVPELRSPYGTGFNNWESAVVGPQATVITYDDQNFRARDATLRPGMRYAELDDSKLGLFEDIESLRVNCGNQGSGSTGRPGAGSSN